MSSAEPFLPVPAPDAAGSRDALPVDDVPADDAPAPEGIGAAEADGARAPLAAQPDRFVTPRPGDRMSAGELAAELGDEAPEDPAV